MRRGHSGIGGWRSENPSHFRPRNSGPPRFRPPRNFGILDTPRFPPPNPRLHHRGRQPFNPHLGHPDDHIQQDYHERHKQNRDGHHHINQRLPDRGHPYTRPRPMHQHLGPNIRQKNSNQSNLYLDPPNFYEDVHVEPYRVNSMGDVDHRKLAPLMPHLQDSYKQQRLTQWINPPYDNRKHHYEDRSPQKSFRHQDSAEASKIPVLDYGGHRPPSSDHYGSTSGPTTNNNNTSFSRSVDDTVDIIRKRLLNRNEPQSLPQHASDLPSNNEQEVIDNANQHIQQEQPTKKRTPKQRHNIKSNCDKMKTNIVHQLFKMDKDKMHKLMDDPGSSTKFEYAISSLITESQNSLNRHLRSVAEKSLYSSSTDFIHNDNNTIYEDTFMKQMQCLLDPQDTVLLEDIKPIVMAELSKVLQLDDFEQRFEVPEDQSVHQTRDNQSNYPYFDSYNYNDYPQEMNYDQEQTPSFNNDNLKTISVTDDINKSYNYDNKPVFEETQRLFDRRPSLSQSIQSEDRRRSSESQHHRRSIDNPAEELFSSNQEEPLPLFDTNTDQVSEDEDTFAELDRQYHVAVDPNFLENDDMSSRGTPTTLQPLQTESSNVKKENDIYLLDSNSTTMKLFTESSKDTLKEISQFIKQEVLSSLDYSKENTTPVDTESNSVQRVEHLNIKQEFASKPKELSKETEKPSDSNIIKTSSSSSRKRSTDQRPSHRKEKRKKRSSSQSDSGKTPLELNVSNAPAKSTEKCNVTPKPYYSMFLPKDESNKESSIDNKKVNNAEKSYSDKYVKRKEPSKKPKGKETEEPRRKRHSSSSHPPIISPKDTPSSHTPTKADAKTKLKTIDMFVEKPKKQSVHHHARRNTATTVTPTKPTVEDSKPKQATTPVRNKTTSMQAEIVKKALSKETQTLQSNVFTSRFSQTDSKKLVSKSIQTEPVVFDTTIKQKSNDAFERMKEIDLEIQVLLQEKFKLYSSLESKDSNPSIMPSLGMTVLNVTPIDEGKEGEEGDNTDSLSDQDNIMTADAIVEEFTSIPVEELEKIAMESVEEQYNEPTKIETRRLRQKTLQQERNSSESPTCSKRIKKKPKPPNISLIEQIITDDRPLEDIISLDDLEELPSKTKKKTPKSRPKKKNSKKGKAVKNVDVSMYDIKDCSVVLIQTDVSKFMSEHSQHSEDSSEMTGEAEERVFPVVVEKAVRPSQAVEESVVNDLQFDMLEVCEDIVIGDSETKGGEEKEHDRVVISEEIILDNSQSSADDVFAAEAGQAESECRTYDYSTDEKLRRDSITVTGNADAVLAIECIENDFIAACLDGNVYHFSNDGQLLNTLRGSNLAVTCLTIVKEKYGTTVYTGSLDSRIRYYDLETGLEKGPECNVLSPIQTMDRAWDTVFVGTRTGFVLQFECKNNMLIPVSTVKFSEQSILALRAIKEGPRKVLLVAARSENVTIKDAQTGLLLRTLSGPKMTVYTLLFEDGKVFCGTSSHQIHVFDYASGAHTGVHEGGKGAVCLRATGGLVFAGCYDGCVYVYREGDTRPLAQLRGPSLMLLSLAVVGSKIIAGYKDRSLYIWKIPLSILQEMIL